MEEALAGSKIDIFRSIGSQEGKGKNYSFKIGYIICHIGSKGGQKGVGFLIRKDWWGKMKEFKGINDRLAVLKMKLENENELIIIMQLYAPKSAAKEEEIEKFYSQVNEIINEQN